MTAQKIREEKMRKSDKKQKQHGKREQSLHKLNKRTFMHSFQFFY